MAIGAVTIATLVLVGDFTSLHLAYDVRIDPGPIPDVAGNNPNSQIIFTTGSISNGIWATM